MEHITNFKVRNNPHILTGIFLAIGVLLGITSTTKIIYILAALLLFSGMFVLAVKDIYFFIKLAVFLTPFNNMVIFMLPFADIRIAQMIWLILSIAIILRRCFLKERLLNKDKLNKFIFFFIVTCLFSTIFSELPLLSLKEFIEFIYMITIFLVLTNEIESTRQIEGIVKVMIIANIIFVAMGFVKMVINYFPLPYIKVIIGQDIYTQIDWSTISEQTLIGSGIVIKRINSFNLGTVECAYYAMYMFFIINGYKKLHKQEDMKAFNTLLFMNVIFLILTFSRAGWVIFICVFFIMNYLNKDTPVKSLVILYIGFFMVLFIPQISNRFMEIFTLKESSSKDHYILYQIALIMGAGKPLFGYGPGTFIKSVQSYKYIIESFNAYTASMDTHNMLLQTWAEQGIFGLISLAMLLIEILRKVITRLGLQEGEKRFLLVGLLTAVASSVLMSLTMNGYKNELFWIVLGLTYSQASIES